LETKDYTLLVCDSCQIDRFYSHTRISLTFDDNCLFVCCFTSRSRIFHLYGDVNIISEGLQNLGLCSAFRAIEKEGIFIVPTWCDTGPPFLRSHPMDGPIQSPLTTHKGMWRIYSNPDPHRSPFSRLLRHARDAGDLFFPASSRVDDNCRICSMSDGKCRIVSITYSKCRTAG
jgi:hypothetical protein